jgi:hypothetical protein
MGVVMEMGTKHPGGSTRMAVADLISLAVPVRCEAGCSYVLLGWL